MDRRTAVLALIVALIVLVAPAAAQDEERHYVYLPSVRFEPTPTATPDPLACPGWLNDPSLETADDAIEYRGSVRVTPWRPTWSVVKSSDNWMIAATGRSLPLTRYSKAVRSGSWGLVLESTALHGETLITPYSVPQSFPRGDVKSAILTFWYKMDIRDGEAPDASLRVLVWGMTNDPGNNEIVGWQELAEIVGTSENVTPPGQWVRAQYDIKQFVEDYRTDGRQWEIIVPGIATNRSFEGIATWYVDDMDVLICLKDESSTSNAEVMYELEPLITVR